MTPREYIGHLCLLVSDEPTTPGVTLEQAQRFFEKSLLLDQEMASDSDAYGWENILTPRRQLRRVLENTATHVDKDWHGRYAMEDAIRLELGAETPESLGSERLVCALVFQVAAHAYAMSILPEIALCRPHDRPASAPSNSEFPAWHRQLRPLEDRLGAMQVCLARTWIPASRQSLHAGLGNFEEARDYLGGDYYSEKVTSLAREVALELNQMALTKLLQGARGAEEDTLARLDPAARMRYQFENAANSLFARYHGDFTHVIAGPAAWVCLHRDGFLKPAPLVGPNPERVAGVLDTPFRVEGRPSVSVWKVPFWGRAHPNTLLLVRCVPHDLTGPLAYSPYRWGASHASEYDTLTHEGALGLVEPSCAVKVELT